MFRKRDHVGLMPGERLCDLGRGGFRVIQMPGDDCFSQDSVLLADFVRVKRGSRVCDLAAGSGALAMLLLARESAISCDLIEIREDLCDRALRTAAMNKVSDRVRAHAVDLREAAVRLGKGGFDLIVSNPPYYPLTGDDMTPSRRLARQQAACDYRTLFENVAALLRCHGRLCLCFPAGQVLDVSAELKNHGLEPKRLRFVSSYAHKAPYLALLEGMKGAKPGLRLMPQLVQFERPGEWTTDMKAIYKEGGDIS
ncbi:MAG: tRNA1(Val) (adenine(37)-N6)-methyltransferase [Christensenellales bacterium]